GQKASVDGKKAASRPRRIQMEKGGGVAAAGGMGSGVILTPGAKNLSESARVKLTGEICAPAARKRPTSALTRVKRVPISVLTMNPRGATSSTSSSPSPSSSFDMIVREMKRRYDVRVK